MENQQQVKALFFLEKGVNMTPVRAWVSMWQSFCCCLRWLTRSHTGCHLHVRGGGTELSHLRRGRGHNKGHSEAVVKVRLVLRGQRCNVVASLALEDLLGCLIRCGTVQL